MAEQGPKRILVRAKTMVFYGGMRIRPGKTFTLTDPAHFSETGMEVVEEPAVLDDTARAVEASPKQRTEAGAALKQKRPGVQAGKGTLDPDPGI